MNTYLKVQNMDMEYIQFRNVDVSLKENIIRFMTHFGQSSYSKQVFRVLKNVSFELHEGDRLAIIGRNGVGKTTLLKLICGIYKPASGSIETRGRISSLIEIGSGFNYELTGRENIYLSGLISGFTKAEIASKEQAIIDFADIGDFIDTQIKYYSTGMGMRLAFSVATTIDPEILIVDELFAGGDINFIEKATRRINYIIRESKIFIAAPHNMDYVREFCNKVLYLKDHGMEYFGDDIEYGIDKYYNDNQIAL